MLARALALAAQGVEDARLPAAPQWRLLPTLPDQAVGDQVAVLARDLVDAVPAAPELVWTPDGPAPLSDVMRDVEATVAEVRRLL